MFPLFPTGKEFSYNNLSKAFELGSSNTVASYISYFEDAYLFFTVPRFSSSLKQQVKNPGSLLENLVYIHFKRLGKKVFYYRQKGECDFIIATGSKVEMAVQVCYNVNADNLSREVNGLVEALNELDLSEGYIFTFEQKDELEKDGKKSKYEDIRGTQDYLRADQPDIGKGGR